jgi:hypothetical protein
VTRLSRLTTAAGLVCLIALAPPARAHEGGRVQLFLSDLEVVPAGNATWSVNATLIDADSGSPASGMDVTAMVGGGPAPTTTPIRLDHNGQGNYSGRLALPPGRWIITIRAKALPAGEPAVPLEKSSTVTLEGEMSGGSPSSQTPPSTGPSPAPLDVRLERSSQPGPGPLWVAVRATVTDAGRPFTAPHAVFVVATNFQRTETEPSELNPVHPGDSAGHPGVHTGFAILPSGGRWTLTATVTRPPEKAGTPPVILGRGGSLEVDVQDVLGSTREPGPWAGAARTPGGGSVLEAGLRWGHTLLAIGWTLTVGLLALLALPNGRRLLSDHAADLLDWRLGNIVRMTWFLAGMVVLTGTIQLAKWTPYEVPLSSGRAERLFLLPWAKPYFLALAVKLAVYAGMIGLSVPLMGQARRRAAAWVDLVVVHRSDDDTPTWLRLVMAGLVTGVAVLTLTVTLLLYFHRVSEVARLG